MGASNSKSDTKGPVPEYRPDFEVIRVTDDPNYGRVKLIRDKKTHQQMILKEFIFDTKQAFEEELNFFKERASFDHPNMVQIIGYNSTQNQNLCSSLFKVSVFIEILAKELDTVLKERKRNRNEYSEHDVLLIAENVISALYHLQTKNMAHGDIRPLNIFALGQSYKITDPKLEIDKNANALVKAILNKSHTLLAPELVGKIPSGKFEFTEDKYKADVFSLGATLLHAATLKNSEDLYDYEKGTFNEHLMVERLEEVRQKYSPFTYQLISDMLRVNENERPDFVGLRDALLPYQEAIQHKGDLPFLSGHQNLFGGSAAVAQKEGKKKAAVLIDQNLEVEEPRQISSQREEVYQYQNTSGTPRQQIGFNTAVQQNVQPLIFAQTGKARVNTQHAEVSGGRSDAAADDLEARIKAALQRSQDTYKQVQANEAGVTSTSQFQQTQGADRGFSYSQNQQFQQQVQGEAGFRPVSFGPNQGLDVQQRFEQDVRNQTAQGVQQRFEQEARGAQQRFEQDARSQTQGVQQRFEQDVRNQAAQGLGVQQRFEQDARSQTQGVQQRFEKEARSQTQGVQQRFEQDVRNQAAQGLGVQQRFEQEARNQTVNADVERAQNAERNVKAFRQVGFEQETNVSRNVQDAPRQIGFEQGRNVQDERRVNAFRQVGFDQETNVSRNVHDAPRQIGFEQAVRSAPRQANEEAAQQIKAPVAEQAQFNVAGFQQQQQVNVPTQNFTSVQQQHFNVGQDRGFGQFDIGNNPAFNRPVEYQQPGFPATTISHETNYQSSHITPSLATQNLDLLESLKRSNEASLAHQQDIQKHIYSQSFGQPTNFEQNVPQHTTTYEAIQSYQPVNIEGLHSTNYNVTSTGLGEHYARNVTGEHAVRSIPGSFASHEVRTVGESIPNYQPVNIEALHSTNYNVTSTGLSGDHYTRNITGEHAVRSSPGGFVSHEVRTGGDNIHSYQPVNTEALYSTNYNITSTGLGEHSYQPVNIEALHSTNYNVTSTGLSGDHYTRNVTGEHAVRSIPGGFASHDVPSTGLGGDHYIRNVTGEHAVRSSPGAAAHDVRKVGEVAGNSTINTAPFTYTTTNYTAGQDVARFGQQKAAEDVMAFSQTHTAGHDFGAQQYQIGGIGSTQEHYFTSTTGHADVGAGMNADIERILKGYQTGDTNVQVQGLAYSPTLERHQVGDIQVGGFAKTDTVTYHGEQHMPGGFADVHVEQSPGGILGEVNSAVSKYTLTGDDAFQHHAQFDGSPTRFV